MPLVKVWNDNHLDYKEKFQEQDIFIKANHYIVMDKEKAIQFKGTYTPIEKDGGGQPLARSFKKIRIEDTTKADLDKTKKFQCVACSFVGLDAKDLDTHTNEMHLDQLIDPDEHKRRIKALQK